MAPLKATTFKLTDDDLALLEAVQRRNGLVSRAEAFRYVLRHWERTEGANGAKPKPPKNRKR